MTKGTPTHLSEESLHIRSTSLSTMARVSSLLRSRLSSITWISRIRLLLHLRRLLLLHRRLRHCCSTVSSLLLVWLLLGLHGHSLLLLAVL